MSASPGRGALASQRIVHVRRSSSRGVRPVMDNHRVHDEMGSQDRFAAVARELQRQQSEGDTLDRIVEYAVEIIGGCDHAAISMVERRKVVTEAVTDGLARAGDEHRYTLGQGPCLDAIWHQETVSSPSLATDDRWPSWATWAIEELGIASMLCFQLFTSEHSYGSLNLYSDREDAFSFDDETTGIALAAHAAVALASSRKIENLNIALLHRTQIGEAKGILMERYDITDDNAFTVLTRVSQDENRKLNAIADELVNTRQTPGT